MKKSFFAIITIFTLLIMFTNFSDVYASEYAELPDSDYQFLDYTDTKIRDRINAVPGLNEKLLELKEKLDNSDMKYMINFITSNKWSDYFVIDVIFLEKDNGNVYVHSYQSGTQMNFRVGAKGLKYNRYLLYSEAGSTVNDTGGTNFSENFDKIINYIDNDKSMRWDGYYFNNYGPLNSKKTNNILDINSSNYYSDVTIPIYSNVDIKLQLRDGLSGGDYNIPLFYRIEKDGLYYQLVVGHNFKPLFQKEDSDNIPTDTDDEVFILDSDKYSYFSWIIEEEKVYDDVWFEMDDIGHYSVGEIKYEYHVKGAAEPVIKKITPKSGKFVEKFSKELFSKIDHFHLEIYIPFQVDNTKYKIIWHNGAIMNDEGQIQDNIFNLSNNPVFRGKYETVDLTNKYAAQLIFKKSVNPRFDYLEFHTLGEFNYYFKKQYGQSETVYDNSRVTDDVLDLTQVYFENLEFIGGTELDSNISLFFVNNNFKKNNTIRTLLEYDSDMFDIVIFDNEWDDKDYVTEDGDHITLKPPSNINPDGSEENNNLLDDISIENILKHSYDMLSSIFDVFSLLGNFVNALLISLPPIFQTVLLWGFTVGIIVIVLKILL